MTLDGAVRPSTPYARKLLEAVVALSRAGQPLFEDEPNPAEQRLSLSAQDLKALHAHRLVALQSHRSLLTLLSCRVALPNSVRTVMDVVVFGSYGGEPYLLLRWDFYSRKFQLLSSGLEAVADESVERQAAYVLTRRLSGYAPSLFRYVRMAEFSTRHLSAGSVDTDPIMRRYDVRVLRATARQGKAGELADLIATHNELATLQVELAPSLDDDSLYDLDFFEWVPLVDILDQPRSHDGRMVQGVAEIIEAIGRDGFIRFADGSIPLDEEAVASTSREVWETCLERMS